MYARTAIPPNASPPAAHGIAAATRRSPARAVSRKPLPMVSARWADKETLTVLECKGTKKMKAMKKKI
jgi:hypothetical protein